MERAERERDRESASRERPRETERDERIIHISYNGVYVRLHYVLYVPFYMIVRTKGARLRSVK